MRTTATLESNVREVGLCVCVCVREEREREREILQTYLCVCVCFEALLRGKGRFVRGPRRDPTALATRHSPLGWSGVPQQSHESGDQDSNGVATFHRKCSTCPPSHPSVISHGFAGDGRVCFIDSSKSTQPSSQGPRELWSQICHLMPVPSLWSFRN